MPFSFLSRHTRVITMAGSTHVVTKMDSRKVQPMRIELIRAAIEQQGAEDQRLIMFLVEHAHTDILECFQACLGHGVGLSGTIGKPVFIDDSIKLVEAKLKTTLWLSLQARYVYNCPFSELEIFKSTLAKYLYRFVHWGK